MCESYAEPITVSSGEGHIICQDNAKTKYFKLTYISYVLVHQLAARRGFEPRLGESKSLLLTVWPSCDSLWVVAPI